VDQKKKKKKVKADELIVLYERLIQNTSDYADLAKPPSSSTTPTTKSTPTGGGDPEMLKEAEAKMLTFKALRGFYLAESYRRIKRYAEAYTLYGRASSQAEEALKFPKELIGTEVISDLKSVLQHCSSLSLFVHTQALLDLEKGSNQLTKDVKQKLTLNESEQVEEDDISTQFLLDRLDSFKTGPASNQYKIIQFPPQFQTAPCKPILFDLAFNHLQSPNLSHRVPKVKSKTIEVKKIGSENKKEIKTKSISSPKKEITKEKKEKKQEQEKEITTDQDKDKEGSKKTGWFSSIWGGAT